jgi:hypothetical protein
MPKTKKRVRPRTGYVMVELSEESRAKLENLRDRLTASTGLKYNLAATFRWLLLNSEK